MAIAVAQVVKRTADFQVTPTGTTQAVTLTVASGSVLLVFVTWGYSGGGSPGTVSCSDSVNGAHTQLGATLDDNVGHQASACFYRKNAGAGSTTVTVTFGTSSPWRALWVVEITGASTAANADGNAGQWQATPGTGANATTSGNQTPAVQPNLLVGWCLDVDGAGIPGLGTGFTSNDTDATTTARVESQRLTSTAAVAATFTAAANESHLTMSAIFDEVAATVLQPIGATQPYVSDDPAPTRRSSIAAILAPPPAPPDSFPRPARPDILDADEWIAPRARVMIAAVLAVVATDTVLRRPQRLVDVEPEQSFLRARPVMAPLLPSPPFVPRPPPRPLLSEADDLPLRRPQIAAAIAAPDTVPHPPGRAISEDAEYLPRSRTSIAALLFTPVADAVLRMPSRPTVSDDEILPGRRRQIAAAIAAPDTILRPLARAAVVADDDALPTRRSELAAILAPPPPDTVLRPSPRAQSSVDDATLPTRRPQIAAAIAVPDTILRAPPRPMVPEEEVPTQRPRPGIAAAIAPAPLPDVVPFARRPVDQGPDDVLTRPWAKVAAILNPPPFISRAPRLVSLPEEDPIPRRAPPVAAVLAPAPVTGDTVLRPTRGNALWSEDDPPPRTRPPIAAAIAAPDFVPRAPARPELADPDQATPRYARPIAALVELPPADVVPRSPRAIATAEDWTAPFRRPGIAAAITPPPPAPAFVTRPNPRQPLSDPHVLPPPRPPIAALLAPPPAPPDFVLPPNSRALLEEEVYVLPPRRPPIAAIASASEAPSVIVPFDFRATRGRPGLARALILV